MKIFHYIIFLFYGLISWPATAEKPPTFLEPYIVDAKLDIDDVAWTRGAYNDASTEQKAVWQDIVEWNEACHEQGRELVLTELTFLGVQVSDPKNIPTSREPVCVTAGFIIQLTENYDDAQSFDTAYDEAINYFHIFKYGARIGFESIPFDPNGQSEDALNIMNWTILDQAFRKATSWENDDRAPKVGSASKVALDKLFLIAFVLEDLKNTKLLKQHVNKKGWPTISMVGETASSSAWLLVQHADHDPAFQYEMLQIMEPLVEQNEVSKSNYAYLYDRVMLKLKGKQRYGTQVRCKDGKRQVLPLEDDIVGEKALDAVRKQLSLGPIAEYMKLFRSFKECE